jgi:hypothetical protein
MPHTLAGSSSANPSSQNFSIAMQFTTRAETLVLRKTLQLQSSPNFQGTTEPCSTSLGVHQNYQAWLRERMSCIQARESERNLATNSSAALSRLLVGKRAQL